ncbi:MAG: DUF488 domain-containing protein [Blastococcus sp.]
MRVRRVYEERRDDDGRRILVDRIWPRGLSKERAHIDEWCRQIAPSTELRTWYHHDPDLYPEFARRYRAELEEPQRAEALERLRQLVQDGTVTVTLLTGATRSDISQASVLAGLIAGRGEPQH